MTEASISAFYLPYPNMEPRRVRVYVPEHEEGELLPVIYMLDGQCLFYKDENPWGCWNVLEAVESERRQTSRGVIIVGIDNGGLRRDNELTPASIGKIIGPNEMENFTEPLGEEFDRFVVEAVMPEVEKRFPVRTDRLSTAICGSSSGGLQSFFTGMEHAERFSMIGAFSPAFLLYSAQSWMNWLVPKLGGYNPYLYIYTGCGDELEQKIYFSTEMLYELLTAMCYPAGLMNEVVLFDYKHNEEAWGEIFTDFLFTFLDRVYSSEEDS